MLHNVNLYNPSFVKSEQYIDESGLLKINYHTADYGYTLLDYIRQDKKNTKYIDAKIYDINNNKAIYKNSFLDVFSNFSINNFIYFNTNKKNSIKKITIDKNKYNLYIKHSRLTIHNLTMMKQYLKILF